MDDSLVRHCYIAARGAEHSVSQTVDAGSIQRNVDRLHLEDLALSYFLILVLVKTLFIAKTPTIQNFTTLRGVCS